MDGVVCSAKEASSLRQRFPEFLLVTPGIRPEWSVSNDQKRIVSPSDAIAMGVDYLVIGRPITQADAPQTALDRIQAEIFPR
jgi:orotidine-5'-phosphate decarboxylase